MHNLLRFPGSLLLGLLAFAVAVPLSLSAQTWDPAPGERIALVGNSLGERMNLHGHFEAMLHTRFPGRRLVIRNFCRPADEVGNRQRPNDYTAIDDPLQAFGPNTFICFFGYNESFAGPSGIEQFRRDYAAFMQDYAGRHGKDGKATFILVTPIAFEKTGRPFQPDGVAENQNLALYAAAVVGVARDRKAVVVDLFSPTSRLFAKEEGAQFTINGCHLNEQGDLEIARMLDGSLFGGTLQTSDGGRFEKLRAAVNDKSWVHLNDYRMLNGWYVYGGRRTWDKETFPLEYKKLRAMASVRDQYIWDIAAGRAVPDHPDDSRTGELPVPKTRFGVPQQAYSEPKELRYLSPEESIQAMTVAPGFEVSCFASEVEFPELAKPVQINFDSKGRLWVGCMPSYPQWRPGDPKPSDRLLIFEDTNQDGKADRCKVFYDSLHTPTGFEFWNGGVLVIDQPRLLFLKDTDGDDKADEVVHLIDGWATDDTHHTMGAFEWSHGGLLHGLEGVSMSTTLETPWGPFRNQHTPGAYVVDPLTLKVSHFITPGYGNPWCYVFNRWGQGIVGDGTTAQQHWDSPLSGRQSGQRKGLNPVFNNESMRPAIGSEFLYSRHLPDSIQGRFVYACVINMNGIPQFEIHDDGAGYDGSRKENLLNSTDRNFRPADPQIGPDGALWFADWHNPLIGHMQYSQRDPNRDKIHGRVYRLTATGRPLLKPVTQAGKPVPELLDQLKEYEGRTRYRARRELRDRPATEVIPATKRWIANLDTAAPDYDFLLCEALRVQQGHHAVDRALIEKLLQTSTPDARAIAVHVLADEWERIARPMDLLRPRVQDDHARVRLEAARALSFIQTPESVELALQIADKPLDYWLDYTLQHTLNASEPVWKSGYEKGDIARNNPAGQSYLKAYVSGRPQLGAAQQHLRRLLEQSDLGAEERARSYGIVASARGKAEPGKDVFNRICVACHKVGDAGVDFAPDLSTAGARLKREDLIESIIDPNAKIDPKFLATNITTRDGEELSGLVSAEDADTVTLVIGSGQRQVIPRNKIQDRQALKVSSMPEGLAQAISAEEFVDLIEFLAAQK